MIYWGKRRDHLAPPEIHPLCHHVLEVAAVLHELLRLPIFRQRLARALGLPDLSPHQVQRLAALAALHDAGKCNHGFQEGREARQWSTHGHVREIFKLLFDSPRNDEGFNALDLEKLTEWFTESKNPATPAPPDPIVGWLWAVFCHHGRPLQGDPYTLGKPQELNKIDARVWNPGPRNDPLVGLGQLAQAIRHTYPEAFVSGGDPLPLTPAGQHLFNGLVTLADWIASDDRLFFPFSPDPTLPSLEILTEKASFALLALGLDLRQARKNLIARSPGFATLFGFPQPNPMQRAIAELPDPGAEHVVVLEAETGSGKTEAALWYFLKLFAAGRVDGLYFALPTRAAAVQIHERVRRTMVNAFGPDHPQVVLAVPGYLRVDQFDGTHLAPFATLWHDETDRLRQRGWAAEHPKRYLAAPIAVGTIDQVLLSALATSHAHMRAASLSRLLLVVDEVHASDAYMTTILREVLKRLRQVGGHALLMSATLGSAARSAFLHNQPRPSVPPLHEAQQHPYPLLSSHHGKEEPTTTPIEGSGPGKTVTVERLPWADTVEKVAAHALAAARTGARVLIIRNTVTWAVTTQLAVEQCDENDSGLLWSCEGVPTVHHARFAAEDRRILDKAILSALGKGATTPKGLAKGLVVVSTQTTEQSLDIDVDYLICDLSPMDVLLQRIGRLHRHERNNRPIAFATPRVMLLEPVGGMATGLTDLGGITSEFARHGWGSVYEDMRVLQATIETLRETPTIHIPADNRRLVEAATHPENLETLANRLGERFQLHATKTWGVRAAQAQQAKSGLYDRDRWLHDCGFHDQADGRLATRLGVNDRLVIFPNPAPMGPFHQLIPTLTIPGHWLPTDLPPEASPENITTGDGEFSFDFASRRFHYNRLGLHPGNRLTLEAVHG